jgi:hypothetical protein
MSDQANAHEDFVAGAEPREVSGDRRANPDTLVAGAADRAPPPVIQASEQECPPAQTPVGTTDDVPQLQLVEVGPVEPTLPVQVERVVIWVDREASEPFVLPPEGIIAFVLGNKHVWRRFMVSTVVVAIATLVVAVALRVAGVQLNSVITVSITSAATALSIVARAYLGQRRRTKQAPTSDTARTTSHLPSPRSASAHGGRGGTARQVSPKWSSSPRPWSARTFVSS